MKETNGLRRSKRQKVTRRPKDYSPEYALLPKDLIFYLLMFVINAKTAVVTWRVCKLWRIATLRFLPKIVTSWDFVNHGTLDLNGRAIWPGSFLNLIRDIGYKTKQAESLSLQRKQSSASKVDVILPNILEIFDSQYTEYKGTLRLYCPCTSWRENARIAFLSGDLLHMDSVNLIRQNKYGQLSLKRHNGKRYSALSIPIWVDNRVDELRAICPEMFPLGLTVQNEIEKLEINYDLIDHYDCKISNGTFKRFNHLFWRYGAGKIKIVDGVFILRGDKSSDSDSSASDSGVTSNDNDGDILLWNDDKLKLKDVEALWNSDILKCEAGYLAIDRWIHYIRCVDHFDFIHFRKVYFEGGYNLQALVKNDKMILFSEIMSVHFK